MSIFRIRLLPMPMDSSMLQVVSITYRGKKSTFRQAFYGDFRQGPAAVRPGPEPLPDFRGALQASTWPSIIKYPAASNGVSSLQRCRAAGYLTLAAFANWPCKHGRLAHCSRE